MGNISYFDGKFEAYQRTYVLMEFERVLPQYLFYVLDDTLKVALYDQKLGNTMPYIKKGMLSEFPISLPPLPEQKRIVGILDEVFSGIAAAVANTEKNLVNARELFESHLNAVFNRKGDGWVEKKLGEIGSVQTGTTPKTSQKDKFGTFIPFIKPADFAKDGSLDYENEGLSKVRPQELSAYAVRVCLDGLYWRNNRQNGIHRKGCGH